MTRRLVGRFALLCLVVLGGACTSRKEGAAPAPAPPAEAPPPAKTDEGAAMTTALECTLSVAPQVRQGQPVEVGFQLRNTTASPLYVLDWHTPLEGLLNDILVVTRDGEELSYSGPMLKRGDPSADDYVTVAPGAAVDARIDASLAYDMTQPGRYRIAFRGQLMDVATEPSEVPHTRDGFRGMPVRCAPVETTIFAP